ncbi:hypothetical protein H206_06152 [Candidatus Electrothrix aarhusensis]|uniref:Uncharacterized protein n=1 Tax=Candidatus Electrothrix aarhusensis TaxID=1859131 RepID=A0A444J3V3_9BACT|nr:hypothetical protein H206_06152 [Candidatus Electrothrix aarhusensis]
MTDNFLRGLGANPFDQAGTEIFLQGPGRSRFQLCGLVRLELPPKLGVDGPGAGELHSGPGKDLHLMDCDGDRLAHGIKGIDPQHGPAVILAMVGYSLDNAFDFFGNMGGM